MRRKTAILDSRRGKIKLVLLIQVLAVIVMAVVSLAQLQRRNREMPDLSVSDWSSDYVVYDVRNGWQIDESKYSGDQPIELIYGPDISLKSGTYRIEVEYFCDHDQECGVYDQEDSFHLKGEEARLSRNSNTLRYDFAVSDKVDHFEFKVIYDGTGYLQVTGISIAPTFFGILKRMCVILTLFLSLDICLLLSDSIKKHRDVLTALAGIALLSSLPLFMDDIVAGDDLWFHLMRIGGIARELRLGHIPVRLSSEWMDGYGYPVSVCYGDLLLYLPALMNLLGFSVTTSYKFYVFLINVGTTAISYYSMKRICRDTRIALIATLAY